MKKRSLSLFLTLCLLLAGCGTAPAPAATAAPVPEASAAPAPAEAAAETHAPETAPAPADPVEEAMLTSVLELLQGTVQIGTAGSSLRAATAAAALLNWAEGTKLDEAQSRALIAAWSEALPEEAREQLPEQVESVRSTAALLAAGGSDAEGLLSDAGLSDHGPWSAEALARALAVLDALAESNGEG